MKAPRRVQPEILDSLPEDAPAALRSRRDLRILNRLMGNGAWIRRTVAARGRKGERVLEIGAGDGALGLEMMAAGLGPVAGLDVVRRPPAWPNQATWFQTSVFDFVSWPDYPVVVASLVFHHFKADELAELGAQLSRGARLVVISEPLRARRAAWLFALACPLIAADAVTRHDGRVSIEAGFRRDELAVFLKLDPREWTWRVRETLTAYRFVAERRG